MLVLAFSGAFMIVPGMHQAGHIVIASLKPIYQGIDNVLIPQMLLANLKTNVEPSFDLISFWVCLPPR
jgi:hypothetical protein